MATINVDKLVELSLNFHRVFLPDLFKIYREGRRLRSHFKTVAAIKDRVVFKQVEVGEVAQAYQKGWTPKGDLRITPEEYMIRYMKVDKDIEPNDLRQTYLADYIPGAASEENELIRKFYQEMVLRAAEDTDNALINGKYAAPTAGEPGGALDMVDGLKEVVKSFVNKGQITPFESEQLDESNACTTLRELWKQIPPRFRYSPKLRCYIFDATWDLYRENYDMTYGLLNVNNNTPTRIHNTSCEVVVLPYGGVSDMALFTMDGNIRLIDNQPSDLMRFEVQKDKRTFNFMMDWAAGIGFVVAGKSDVPEEQFVWCNEFDYLQGEAAEDPEEPSSSDAPSSSGASSSSGESSSSAASGG
jgi:hypothetical protein